jgi:hypothetical protein
MPFNLAEIFIQKPRAAEKILKTTPINEVSFHF